LRSKDLLTLQTFSSEEIWQLLKTTRKLKEGDLPEPLSGPLKNKSILLLFQKASTRTRVSFEVAIHQLGGQPLYLGWAEAQLGRGETIADTARVLSRYVDGVVARVYRQADLEEMAKHASIPVINALSDLFHPCQIVADLYTMWERWKTLEDLKVAYVGDGNNVCNSLLIGCSKLGIDISVACPPGYRPYPEAVKWARENAEESGSSVEIVEDPVKAVKGANVIYTDTFVSMGAEAEREERLKVFLPRYQVRSELFLHAAEDAVFMHCLPARRGEEVTDEVIDGPRSVVWDQAENRLHTAKAILAHLI